MLKPKVAKEMLKVCKTKQEVTQMFLDKYGSKKAIRLIKRETARSQDDGGRLHSDYKLTFSCDNCGDLFVRMDSDKSPIKCPKCGHKVKVEHGWKGGEYLDETYESYSYVLSDNNRMLEPSTALHEIVNFEGVDYHVMRRFHFSLERGEIVDVRMAKCIIAGLCKVRGSILLYENDEGVYKTSKPCNASNWFTNYKYREIQCKNFLFEDDDEKSFDDHLEEVSDAHYAARRYYNPTIAMARELLDRFSVNENLSFAQYGSELEVYDTYFVHRIFRQGAEKERWVYSYKENVNAVMEFSDGEWVVTDTENPYDYHDDIFLYNKEKLKGSFVDKLGLFCVVEDKDVLFDDCCSRDGVVYLSKLHKYPITETLVKIGLKSLLEGVYNNRLKIHETRTKIWQRLCLTKANYDLLFEFDATSDSCETLQRLNEFDKRVDLEALKAYCSREIYFNLYSAEKVMSENKFNFKQIVDYLFSVQEEQGFIPNQAIDTWRDYLSMFEEFYGYRPKKKEDKYPDSLKKAHDLVSMYILRKKENTDSESFSSMNEKWKKLNYADEKFCISLPASSADLNLESKELGHCVHTYSSYIRNEHCVILFLRKANEPDKPFFTMEFDCHDRLVQVRGKSNREIMDINDKHKDLREDMISFLRKWGRLKHIKTGFEKTAKAA